MRARGIRLHSATDRAFADSADDILPPAKTLARTRSASLPAGEIAHFCRSYRGKLPQPTFAQANDRKSPSDIECQHQVLADAKLSDCGVTRKHRAIHRMSPAMDRTPLPLLRHGRFCPCRRLHTLDYPSCPRHNRRLSREPLSNYGRFPPHPKNNLRQKWLCPFSSQHDGTTACVAQPITILSFRCLTDRHVSFALAKVRTPIHANLAPSLSNARRFNSRLCHYSRTEPPVLAGAPSQRLRRITGENSNTAHAASCGQFDRDGQAAMRSGRLWQRRFRRGALSFDRVVSAGSQTQPNWKNCAAKRSLAHVVFTFAYGAGSTALLGHRTTTDPRAALHCGSAPQRHYDLAHAAWYRSGT